MVKFMCVLVLLAVSCHALPLEEASEHPRLTRPSPINPEVASDPEPTEAAKQVSTTEGHVQKIPASGVKLSVEVAKNEQTSTSTSTTTTEPSKQKSKRSLENESPSTSSAKPAFRRNQPTTSTEQPASTTASSTTSSPVSVKTPVGTTRAKREVDVTAATPSPTSAVSKRTTTLSPSAYSASNDDKEGPHFVRPVPVDQILKNLGEKPERHHKTESVKESEPKEKKEEEKQEEEPSSSSQEEEKSSGEANAQESSASHPKNHPVIRQQGA